MTRSEVFFKMNEGTNALNDLQLAVKCGLMVKNNAEYYAKLAKFYACEWIVQLFRAPIVIPFFRSAERRQKS